MTPELTRVAVQNQVIKMDFAPYRLQLHWTRVGNWELWAMPERGIAAKEEKIGGQWERHPFDLFIGTNHVLKNRWQGAVTVDSMPTEMADSIRIGTMEWPVKAHGEAIEIFAPEEVQEMIAEYVTWVGAFFWSGVMWSVSKTERSAAGITFWHSAKSVEEA